MALAERSFSRKYHIQLQKPKILSTKSCYMNITKEPTDTEFHPNNMYG